MRIAEALLEKKEILSRLIGCSAAMVIALGMQVSQAAIEDTKHNLTRIKGQEVPASQVCVFCHTPHGNTEHAMTPLWKPSSKTPEAFTTFDSLGRSMIGESEAVGSVSVACLSCHDDTQAFGVTNLSYDHPFGVPYRGVHKETYEPSEENAALRPFKAAEHLKDINFKVAEQAIINEIPIWWVETGDLGRQRTDLQLFSRKQEDDTTVPFVECASCHDPHNSNTTFLRITNEGSRLCYTCHEGK